MYPGRSSIARTVKLFRWAILLDWSGRAILSSNLIEYFGQAILSRSYSVESSCQVILSSNPIKLSCQIILVSYTVLSSCQVILSSNTGQAVSCVLSRQVISAKLYCPSNTGELYYQVVLSSNTVGLSWRACRQAISLSISAELSCQVILSSDTG